MNYDAVIIGAGMSGLAAGIRMAHYGKKVCIIEKHFTSGGLNSYYRRGGYNLDVGLHAMTNYVSRGNKSLSPFVKILRQLRLKYDDFAPAEQLGSRVCFKSAALKFTNDFESFKNDVYEKFGSQKENFEKLLSHINNFNELDLNAKPLSAREVLSNYITDPLLADMILCPLSYYGSASECDMEFGQFVVMFKSIFMEGFSRPYEGVRRIINLLEKRFLECGGELRLKTGAEKIEVRCGHAAAVLLSSGEEITASKVLSTIGLVETMGICSDKFERPCEIKAGNLSFTELIMILKHGSLEAMNHRDTIIFYNDSDSFTYKKPLEIVDYRSGVICCPNNFKYEKPFADEMIRVTNMANHDIWMGLSAEEYGASKNALLLKAIDNVKKFVPLFNRDMITFHDIFTPKTVRRFTGHINGAVYGTPDKTKNGSTRIDNLFIAGTDQGFLGIIGAILSGISIANLHFLLGERQ